jgi:hypothetical protein
LLRFLDVTGNSLKSCGGRGGLRCAMRNAGTYAFAYAAVFKAVKNISPGLLAAQGTRWSPGAISPGRMCSVGDMSRPSRRLALGAQPSVVTSSFVRQGLNLAWIDGAIGLASAAGLSRWISSLLFGIRPLDPLTYLASGMIIVVAAMAASRVPARQAASDPIDTLRGD